MISQFALQTKSPTASMSQSAKRELRGHVYYLVSARVRLTSSTLSKHGADRLFLGVEIEGIMPHLSAPA